MADHAIMLSGEGRGLAPVTFDEDILAAAVSPMTGDPVSAVMWRFDVGAGNPDVVVAFVAMVAGVPNPITMFAWWWGNDFAGRRRGADTNVDLCVSDTCGEEESASGGEE